MLNEIWANVGSDYQVSNLGNVRSLVMWTGHCYRKRNEPKVLKKSVSTTGYEKVKISINGIKRDYKVHRLVATAFIPKVEGKEHINHKDGNKKNNNVENLEWCNRSENMRHAYANGLICRANKPKPIKQPLNKYHVPKEQFKNDILSGMRNVDVAKKYNCSIGLVATRKHQIKKGEY